MGNFLYCVEILKRFVKVHLHCIVRNLKKISGKSTLTLLEKFLRTPMAVLLIIKKKHFHIFPLLVEQITVSLLPPKIWIQAYLLCLKSSDLHQA